MKLLQNGLFQQHSACLLLSFLKAVLLYLFCEILVIPQKRRGFLYASADIFMSFELPCKIMILIGIGIMFLLTVLLILLLKNRLFLYKLEYYKFPAYKTSF